MGMVQRWPVGDPKESKKIAVLNQSAPKTNSKQLKYADTCTEKMLLCLLSLDIQYLMPCVCPRLIVTPPPSHKP